MNSQDDVSAVEKAIARKAAVAGDLQLAFDLCLSLVKKGHGPIWDLCVVIARGPTLENMDINSQKQLLGFALNHCDEESIGELLHTWKDLDTQDQWETLMMSIGANPPNFSIQGSSVISLPVRSIHDIVGLKDCSKLDERWGAAHITWFDVQEDREEHKLVPDHNRICLYLISELIDCAIRYAFLLPHSLFNLLVSMMSSSRTAVV